jgi:hypothetical protein
LGVSKLLLGSKSFPLNGFSMPLNRLVIQVKPGNDDGGAIEGCVVTVGSCSWVCWRCVMIHVDVKEGVDSDHLSAHVVCPLQYLRSYIDKEGVGGPATEDHDLGRRDVIDEECIPRRLTE